MAFRKKIQHIHVPFQHERMVHRTALEMPTVLKDLLRRLIAIDLQSSFQPLRRLTLLSKKTPGKYEGASVLKKMIAQQVGFYSSREVRPLLIQASLQIWRLEISLAPIDNSKRGGIWMPSRLLTYWIGGNPLSTEDFLDRSRQSMQIVKVVKFELPKGRCIRLPVNRTPKLLLLIQECYFPFDDICK